MSNFFVTYTLFDAFTDTVAAGSVNGTTSTSPVATGGGVTRTVTDGNSKLSIGSGVASFATGGVGAGNPGLWYASVARAAGRILIGTIVPGTGQSRFGFGWDSTAAGTILDDLAGNSGTLQARVNGSSAIFVGAYSASTSYSIALVMRAAGMWFFIKGGAFTYWNMVYLSTLGNAAGIPATNVDVGTTQIWTADDIRVPVPTYIPVPLAYDTFTRADGALGSSETTSPDSVTGTALTWTSQAGTWAIASNVAGATALASSIAVATVPTASADALIDVSVTRSAGVGGGVARYQSSTDYLIFYHDGTNAKCDKVVSGSTTNLVSAAATYSAGAVLRLIVSGTTGWLFYNNAAVGASFTVPSSSQVAHGLYSTDTGNTLDNFTVWARGTANEHYFLDNFSGTDPAPQGLSVKQAVNRSAVQ